MNVKLRYSYIYLKLKVGLEIEKSMFLDGWMGVKAVLRMKGSD